MNILVIDDEKTIADLLVKAFLSRGETAIPAYSLVAAEDILNKSTSPFDVIISDVHLGNDSGTKLVETIRTKHGSYPTLLYLTGDDHIEDKTFYDLGADAVFRKGRCSVDSIYSAARHFQGKAERIRSLLEQQEAVKRVEERRAELSNIGEVALSIIHEVSNAMQLVTLGFEKHFQLVNKVTEDESNPLRKSTVLLTKGIERMQRVLKASTLIFKSKSAEPECHDVDSLLFQVEELISERLKQTSVNLKIVRPTSATKVQCVPIYLHQIMTNLIFNAADGVSDLAEKWISIQTVQRNDVLDIVVTDSGGGIPVAMRERIFLLHFTTKKTGSGIGLSISRHLARTMNGDLFLDENESNTTFVLRLKLVKA